MLQDVPAMPQGDGWTFGLEPGIADMVAPNEPYLGKGVYSIPDAARIVGVHYNTVRRWLDPDVGIIKRAFDPVEQRISFPELMELHFVKMFEGEGVSFQASWRPTRNNC